MDYIHYGEKFDRTKFNIIKNTLTPKPQGGFWMSKASAKFGWKDWVKAEGMEDDKSRMFNLSEENKNVLSIKDNAKILVIDSVDKVDLLERVYGTNPRIDEEDKNILHNLGWKFLNFEEIAKCFDVIDFVLSADSRLYQALYSWDCDSTLVLNPDVVMQGV